jgi:hypothetical protein
MQGDPAHGSTWLEGVLILKKCPAIAKINGKKTPLQRSVKPPFHE